VAPPGSWFLLAHAAPRVATCQPGGKRGVATVCTHQRLRRISWSARWDHKDGSASLHDWRQASRRDWRKTMSLFLARHRECLPRSGSTRLGWGGGIPSFQLFFFFFRSKTTNWFFLWRRTARYRDRKSHIRKRATTTQCHSSPHPVARGGGVWKMCRCYFGEHRCAPQTPPPNARAIRGMQCFGKCISKFRSENQTLVADVSV
jgi:hypothetical protein